MGARNAIKGLLSAVFWLIFMPFALAGTLERSEIERFFPKPYSVGDKDADIAVWPIFQQNATSDELIAYAYESVDFSPIPGFSGTPVNLLIAVTPQGEFLEAKVLSHHEPIFLDGLGEEPLFEFVKQYAGKSLKQSIKIGPHSNDTSARSDAMAATIDGITKATASVRIINETIIASALQVARAKLGFSAGRDPSKIAQARPDPFEPLSFAQLLARGLVKRLVVSNAQVEAAFKDTVGEGLDRAALASPEAAALDIYVGELDVPIIGRNLLGEAEWKKMMAGLNGAPAFMVLSTGQWTFMPESFVAGATPDRLAISQSNAPVALRDFAWRGSLLSDAPQGDFAILRIAPETAFDPASPAVISFRITREKGQIYPERVAKDFALFYQLPAEFFILPSSEEVKGLMLIWKARALDIGILLGGLSLLTFALFKQKLLVQSPRAFYGFRLCFLAFTLLFIGFWAQAQLSIVWLLGAIKALRWEGSFAFMLYDPPSLILLGFTLISLLIWGRGTFCGWLCPFGALQEFAGEAAKILGLKQYNLPAKYERLSRAPKFLILAGIVLAALFSKHLADSLVEVEPFKTAITLVFIRSLPFVAYALLLLFIGMFHYKFFCRYLCPLGASLAAVSFVRRWNWLPRRAECGTPCQLCKVKCRYGAIQKSGAIVYSECFQCMDCVVIHDDPAQCVPLVLQNKRNPRTIITRKVPA